jgi:hypothetical protein
VHDASLPTQGYELALHEDGVEIRHADDDGLRYAEQALAQIEAGVPAEAERLPGGRVGDHPDVLHRGFMLDISRDRVPTMETLASLVERLATCRINELQLYTEHTFAYREHEAVWRDASPLTHDEVRTLDAWCRDAGIELVANQNCFGHFERWLVRDEYRDRAECPDGWTFPVLGGRREPSTLAPTPENAAFVVELVEELTDSITSRSVNIGCDETFELGKGASREAVAARGKTAVFTEHLLRIVGPLHERDLDVQFWGDMVRRDAELVARLPRSGLTALTWNYEAPAQPGSGDLNDLIAGLPELAAELALPDDAHIGFASHARAFAETGFPFRVAPGTSSWNTLLGRWTNARANLLDAATTGVAMGADGVLITDWGDNGHFQPPLVSLLPLAYGAAVAWCADANRDLDAPAAVDRFLLDTPDDPPGAAPDAGLGDLLARLGDLYSATGLDAVNGSPLFYALFPEPPLPVWGTADERGLAAVTGALEDALSGAAPDELTAAVRLARHGAWRIARRAGLDRPSDRDLLADLDETVEIQRAAWLAGSRPGGLADSLARLTPARGQYTERA